MDKKNKIGILYICTGEYWRFFEGFYESCQRNFLNECELQYYVFTDDLTNTCFKKNNVVVIEQENLKWPYPTLMRYDIFIKNKAHYLGMDYLIFCNANLIFTEKISLQQLFQQKYGLFCTIHPGLFHLKGRFPYESNVLSTAFLKPTPNSLYVAGGFNGGTINDYLYMAEVINENIGLDLERGIVAKWHDESHLNLYFHEHRDDFNVLGYEYLLPEGNMKDCKPKIVVLDKHKLISLYHKGFWYYMRYHLSGFVKQAINYIGRYSK